MFLKNNSLNFSKTILFPLFILVIVICSMVVIVLTSEIVEAIAVTKITPEDGGKLNMSTVKPNKVSVEFPPNAVPGITTFSITLRERASLLMSIHRGKVPSDKYIVGDFYKFKATTSWTKLIGINVFEKEVTTTITYTDEQIENLDESKLAINYWNNADLEWVALETIVDAESNILTANTDQCTCFVVLGEEIIEEEKTEEEPEEEELAEEQGEEEEKEKPISEMTTEELQNKIAEILIQINVLKVELSEITKEIVYEGIPADFTFENNLRYGDNSDEVKYLQIILKKEIGSPSYPIDVSATGWFGSITKQSLIEFQEKYSFEILASFNITTGTGFMGRTTRAKLNSLLGR